MAAAGSSATLYCKLSAVQVSDFTPSRVTRPSSNTLLQEHDSLSALYCAGAKPRSRSDLTCVASASRAVALKGRYVDLDFVNSYSAGTERQLRLGPLREEQVFAERRAHSQSDPSVPLCIRSRGDYKRTAVRRRHQTDVVDDSCCTRTSSSTMMMDTASFERKAWSGAEQARLPADPTIPIPMSAAASRIKRQQLSPLRSSPPPPVPPAPYRGSFLARVRSESKAGAPEGGSVAAESDLFAPKIAEVGPETLSPPGASSGYVSLHRRLVVREGEDASALVSSSAFSQLLTEESVAVEGGGKAREEEEEEEGDEEIASTEHLPPTPPRSPPRHRYVNIDELDSPSVNRRGADSVSTPLGMPHRHQTLPSTPTGFIKPSSAPPLDLFYATKDTVCPGPLSLSQLPQTKPVPPPRRASEETLRCLSDSRVAWSKSSQHPDARRTRSVSFLQCKAGVDHGMFVADYLGSGQSNSYLNAVDQVAKQLVDSRPVEVVTYVTSERVRLAPPNNASLLFKSFAMKDILTVQRCSKNKRIVGVVLWKSCKAIPICHVLRCTDHLVAGSLYEAIRLQSQCVDEVTLSKVSRCQPRPPSDISSSGGSNSSSPELNPPSSSPSALRDSPLSPSELLHQIPAIYVGSAVAGKLHSVNEVIEKVLTESRPNQAKEVSVWLSVAQVRLVDTSETEDIIYATHETSRIRAIGVYSLDKRFIGYIIKEEGKPLTGYVLRCNSAGLMVSLVSFLRQSCQITFHQRGGSFYDELSADDSEGSESSESSMGQGSPGILKRLRSLTASNPKSTPTFVSHTTLLRETSDSPPRQRDSIRNATVMSPLDFTEEDYAQFSVNYIGSATLAPPMTPWSVVDALELFSNEGVAKGQAAVPKNVIQMQISALGINLSDKKHKLFVNRNYPRNQIAGYCLHPNSPKYFAFGSQRPGFPDDIKCHIFKPLQATTEQIMDAVKFWLEMDPIS